MEPSCVLEKNLRKNIKHLYNSTEILQIQEWIIQLAT